MPGDATHWVFLALGVAIFVIFGIVVLVERRRDRKEYARLVEREIIHEPRSMVKIVDPSTPLSRRRPRIFDDDELA